MPNWIYDWQSNVCPVDRHQMVEVMFRNGAILRRPHAGNFCWHRFASTEPSEIIAYRPV